MKLIIACSFLSTTNKINQLIYYVSIFCMLIKIKRIEIKRRIEKARIGTIASKKSGKSGKI